ncbi:hypothetical protein B9G55_13215 [Saccharibacillus sp. O16]|nr:hypothetical protein B9G55_13215 [Saccharibacillus sp. O16]
MMNVDIAREALRVAETGNIDDAEQVLVEFYDADTTRLYLSMMQGIKAFRPRMRLAHKALIDYEEGRYHACVPVVLALLDGLVNEIHESNKGFFAEGVEFEAWNSFAAHSKGLGQITSVLRKGRKKSTNVEQITLPYRNGILHGRDLEYDSKLVAAKTWATLFSLRDWALKVEKGTDKPPIKEPEKSLREKFAGLLETSRESSELQKWQPREISLNENFIFQEDTPEMILKTFLELWMKKNWGNMSQLIYWEKVDDSPKPKKVKQKIGNAVLKGFEILSIEDTAAAVTKVEVDLKIEKEDVTSIYRHTYTLTNSDEANRYVRRGKPGSAWKIENWNYQTIF